MKNDLLVNPYETTYGKMLNTTTVQKELIKFNTVISGEKLNYEFGNNLNTEIMFITGYNQEEKALPIFDHPLVFNSIRGKQVIAVDFRKYVRSVNEKPLYLKDIVKDASNLEFLVIRTLLTAEWLEGNTGILRNIDTNFASGFAMFISGLFTVIAGLNPVDKVNVEIAICHYFYNMHIVKTDRNDMQNNVYAKIAKTPLSLPVSIKIVDSVLKNADSNVENMDGLIANIKSVLNEDKVEYINGDALYSLIATMWYGPGGSETMYMSLEHIPTWVAMMGVSVSNNTFKKSRLATTLEKYSSKIKPNDVKKGLELYIKENTI